MSSVPTNTSVEDILARTGSTRSKRKSATPKHSSKQAKKNLQEHNSDDETLFGDDSAQDGSNFASQMSNGGVLPASTPSSQGSSDFFSQLSFGGFNIESLPSSQGRVAFGDSNQELEPVVFAVSSQGAPSPRSLTPMRDQSLLDAPPMNPLLLALLGESAAGAIMNQAANIADEEIAIMAAEGYKADSQASDKEPGSPNGYTDEDAPPPPPTPTSAPIPTPVPSPAVAVSVSVPGRKRLRKNTKAHEESYTEEDVALGLVDGYGSDDERGRRIDLDKVIEPEGGDDNERSYADHQRRIQTDAEDPLSNGDDFDATRVMRAIVNTSRKRREESSGEGQRASSGERQEASSGEGEGASSSEDEGEGDGDDADEGAREAEQTLQTFKVPAPGKPASVRGGKRTKDPNPNKARRSKGGKCPRTSQNNASTSNQPVHKSVSQGTPPKAKPSKESEFRAFKREVKRLCMCEDAMIPLRPFSRLMHEIASAHHQDIRITREAVIALREATEHLLTYLFETAYLATIHRKAVTLQNKDLELVIRIWTKLMPWAYERCFSHRK